MKIRFLNKETRALVRTAKKFLRRLYIRLGLANPRTNHEIEQYLIAPHNRSRNRAVVFSHLLIVRRSRIAQRLAFFEKKTLSVIELDYDFYRITFYRWLAMSFNEFKYRRIIASSEPILKLKHIIFILFRRFVLEPFVFYKPYAFGFYKRMYLALAERTGITILSNFYIPWGAMGAFTWVYWFSISVEISNYNIIEEARFLNDVIHDDLTLPQTGVTGFNDAFKETEEEDFDPNDNELDSRFIDFFYDDVDLREEEDMFDEEICATAINYDVADAYNEGNRIFKFISKLFLYWPGLEFQSSERDGLDVDFLEWIHQHALWIDIFLRRNRKRGIRSLDEFTSRFGSVMGSRYFKEYMYESRGSYARWCPHTRMRTMAAADWSLLDMDLSAILEQDLYETGRLLDTFFFDNCPINIADRAIPVIANEFKYRHFCRLFPNSDFKFRKRYTTMQLLDCARSLWEVDLDAIDKHYFEYEYGFLPSYVNRHKISLSDKLRDKDEGTENSTTDKKLKARKLKMSNETKVKLTRRQRVWRYVRRHIRRRTTALLSFYLKIVTKRLIFFQKLERKFIKRVWGTYGVIGLPQIVAFIKYVFYAPVLFWYRLAFVITHFSSFSKPTRRPLLRLFIWLRFINLLLNRYFPFIPYHLSWLDLIELIYSLEFFVLSCAQDHSSLYKCLLAWASKSVNKYKDECRLVPTERIMDPLLIGFYHIALIYHVYALFILLREDFKTREIITKQFVDDMHIMASIALGEHKLGKPSRLIVSRFFGRLYRVGGLSNSYFIRYYPSDKNSLLQILLFGKDLSVDGIVRMSTRIKQVTNTNNIVNNNVFNEFGDIIMTRPRIMNILKNSRLITDVHRKNVVSKEFLKSRHNMLKFFDKFKKRRKRRSILNEDFSLFSTITKGLGFVKDRPFVQMSAIKLYPHFSSHPWFKNIGGFSIKRAVHCLFVGILVYYGRASMIVIKSIVNLFFELLYVKLRLVVLDISRIIMRVIFTNRFWPLYNKLLGSFHYFKTTMHNFGYQNYTKEKGNGLFGEVIAGDSLLLYVFELLYEYGIELKHRIQYDIIVFSVFIAPILIVVYFLYKIKLMFRFFMFSYLAKKYPHWIVLFIYETVKIIVFMVILHCFWIICWQWGSAIIGIPYHKLYPPLSCFLSKLVWVTQGADLIYSFPPVAAIFLLIGAFRVETSFLFLVILFLFFLTHKVYRYALHDSFFGPQSQTSWEVWFYDVISFHLFITYVITFYSNRNMHWSFPYFLVNKRTPKRLYRKIYERRYKVDILSRIRWHEVLHHDIYDIWNRRWVVKRQKARQIRGNLWLHPSLLDMMLMRHSKGRIHTKKKRRWRRKKRWYWEMDLDVYDDWPN